MSFADWLIADQSASFAASEIAYCLASLARTDPLPAARSWLAEESANCRAIAA